MKPLNGKYILLLKLRFKFIPLSNFCEQTAKRLLVRFLAVVLFIMYCNCFW
jgi:hypothetical protein